MEHQDTPERHIPTTPPPGAEGTPPPSGASAMSQADERQWAMLTHLSALLGAFTGIGFIVAPLIMWLIKKDQSAFVDDHGKEAVNFQITMMIAMVVSGALIIVLIGIVLLPIVFLIAVILPVIAGLKANEGQMYRYPMTIRLIK